MDRETREKGMNNSPIYSSLLMRVSESSEVEGFHCPFATQTKIVLLAMELIDARLVD